MKSLFGGDGKSVAIPKVSTKEKHKQTHTVTLDAHMKIWKNTRKRWYFTKRIANGVLFSTILTVVVEKKRINFKLH